MTTPNVERDTTGHRRTLISQLADPRKRFVLAHVQERAPSTVSVDELATHLAAFSRERPADGPSDQRRRSRIALQHSLVPALEDAGLIERVGDGSEVRSTDRLSSEDEFVAAVSTLEESSDVDLDALLDALADRRRRAVVSVLEERDDDTSTRALSRAVANREEGADDDASDDRVDDVYVSLVHVHLPLLADALLVDYDSETVSTDPNRSEGIRELLDLVLEDEVDSRLETTGGPSSHSISTFSS